MTTQGGVLVLLLPVPAAVRSCVIPSANTIMQLSRLFVKPIVPKESLALVLYALSPAQPWQNLHVEGLPDELSPLRCSQEIPSPAAALPEITEVCATVSHLRQRSPEAGQNLGRTYLQKLIGRIIPPHYSLRSNRMTSKKSKSCPHDGVNTPCGTSSTVHCRGCVCTVARLAVRPLYRA